jgi:hypothetical protein
MAVGNEWINGYLEAILDAGVKLREQRGAAAVQLPPLLPAPEDAASAVATAATYSPTRYFVEEVVSRFDDRDLHKTWTKVCDNLVSPPSLAGDRSCPAPAGCCSLIGGGGGAGGGDEEQPGEEQPAGEPVLEDLERREEEEAGTPPIAMDAAFQPRFACSAFPPAFSRLYDMIRYFFFFFQSLSFFIKNSVSADLDSTCRP